MEHKERSSEEVEAREVPRRPTMKPRRRLPSERADTQQRVTRRNVDPISTLRILQYFEHNAAPSYKLSSSAQGWQRLLRHFHNRHPETTTARPQWNMLPRHIGEAMSDSSPNIDFLRRENVNVYVCDFLADKARSYVQRMSEFEPRMLP
jgi:hypothetical protein